MRVACAFIRSVVCGVLCCVFSLAAGEANAVVDGGQPFPAATDWPWWRGPQRNGVAASDQRLPLKWSAEKNVLWKTAVPGRGFSSPIVVGDQIFLTTADEQQGTQLALCFDRRTGALLWQHVVHRGGLMTEGLHVKASHASSSVACDGERLFVNFANGGAVYTTALSRAGETLWQTRISDYVVHQGYASSPAVYGPLVIVASDNKGGGAIAGLERTTGEVVWKHERPKKPNYVSPTILRVADRDQLFLAGCDLVSSFAPLTGEKLWELEGSTTECVTSIVNVGERIFTSGGYPKNHVAAWDASAEGKWLWEKSERAYVPSLLAKDDHLYLVTDPGVAACWDAATGKEVWSARLGGTFSASPVLVGEHILAINERGQAFIFKATPQAYELVAENQLGDEAFATPTVCDSRIYARVAHGSGSQRRETLYCIEAAP